MSKLNFLHFHAVFGKIWPNNRLVALCGWCLHPRLGNPGSSARKAFYLMCRHLSRVRIVQMSHNIFTNTQNWQYWHCVFPYICSFVLDLHHMMLVNVKLDVSGCNDCISRLQTSLALPILIDTAKMK